ncbi:MAG: VWA domain-containing protein [Chromatiales bacterium]|nr:VWA domain-containing protein [Chromatiales bacterium]
MKDLRKNDAKSPSVNRDVDAFLRQVAATPSVKAAGKPGRLLFAMDATASREPTWDRACDLQGQMFEETATLGGLDVQLAWYRGFREFHASPWVRKATDLLAQMTGVRCLGGRTQIGRVLDHAIAETKRERINALVLVGDCMEEDIDDVCHRAGQLGLLGVPAFVFQEGRDPVAETAFRQIAQLTRGAWCPFDHNSAQQLRELLRAVAVFAAGGRRALADHSKRHGGLALRLTHQIGN